VRYDYIFVSAIVANGAALALGVAFAALHCCPCRRCCGRSGPADAAAGAGAGGGGRANAGAARGRVGRAPPIRRR